MRRGIMLAPILALVAGAAAAQDEGFYLKDGDRVVFYGDSITDQRLYTTFVETFVVTRLPGISVQFTHSGWGGDRVGGGAGGKVEKRIERDVLAYRPSVVTIMLGMNDASYRPFDEKLLDGFGKGYEQIVSRIKKGASAARLTLIEPSPFDDVTRPVTFEGGYNAVLLRYGERVRDIARREKLDVADLNSPVVAALERARATDPALAQKILPDRVHPGPGGHLVMAAALLRAWRAPAVVSSVALDVAAKKVVRSENTDLSKISLEKGGLAWTQEDASLPWPIDTADPAVALAVRSSSVLELDVERLAVTGLDANDYRLEIDGEAVSSFSKEQLGDGVELALLPTPMRKQAQRVHALTVKHGDLHQMRWRQLQVPYETDPSPNVARTLEAIDALEADVVSEQRAAAKPKPHRWSLVPAK